MTSSLPSTWHASFNAASPSRTRMTSTSPAANNFKLPWKLFPQVTHREYRCHHCCLVISCLELCSTLWS